MKNFNLENAANLLGIDPALALNIYRYGSRVYGTHSDSSDHDYIMIVHNSLEDMEYIGDNVDVKVYTEDSFKSALKNHEISCLECLWLPEEMKYETVKFEFELELPKLRESISAKASNSYVKCKKKFVVPESFDPYIGKKSLWHCFRMIEFGIQIATFGRIADYTAMNYFYLPLMNMPNEWEVIKATYQPEYNATMSEFRSVAPKKLK